MFTSAGAASKLHHVGLGAILFSRSIGRPQTEAGSGGVEAFLLGDLLQLAMIATPTRNGYLFSRRSRMAKSARIVLNLV